MKTLDEVINIFEKACDLERRCKNCSGCLSYDDGCPNDGVNAVPDALHYLKAYRKHLIQDLDELRQKKYELEINMKLDALLREKPWEKRK